MKYLLQKTPLLLIIIATTLVACSDSGNDGPAPVEAQMASDIAANINPIISTERGPVTDIEGNTKTTPGYTFYDLHTGQVVTDSLSADWDIAFGGTTILANTGNGGGIALVETAYADVTTMPEGITFEASNRSWYTYTAEIPNLPPHAILPNKGQTLIVRTNGDHYAKVQIHSYYEGNPDVTTGEFSNLQTRPTDRYFTFDFALNSNGGTDFFHVDSYTFYDLSTGKIVEDSLSSQWDIGLQGTSIIANTGNDGGLQELSIAFAELTEAPSTGYVSSNQTWYNYTGAAPSGPQHAVLPVDGVTLVFQTPDNEYAKVRIISYYYGNPDVTSQEFIDPATRPDSRYYTFEYAVQTDGSRFFE